MTAAILNRVPGNILTNNGYPFFPSQHVTTVRIIPGIKANRKGIKTIIKSPPSYSNLQNVLLLNYTVPRLRIHFSLQMRYFYSALPKQYGPFHKKRRFPLKSAH